MPAAFDASYLIPFLNPSMTYRPHLSTTTTTEHSALDYSTVQYFCLEILRKHLAISLP